MWFFKQKRYFSFLALIFSCHNDPTYGYEISLNLDIDEEDSETGDLDSDDEPSSSRNLVEVSFERKRKIIEFWKTVGNKKGFKKDRIDWKTVQNKYVQPIFCLFLYFEVWQKSS